MCLHTTFDTLPGFFDWVGLQKNVQKTMGYGLPTMWGSGGPGGKVLKTPDEGRGAELPGEAIGTVKIYGVR